MRVQRLGQLLAALTGLLLGLMVPPEPAAKGHQRENDQRQQPNTIAHPEAGKPILAQRVVDFAQKNLVVLWREGQHGSRSDEHTSELQSLMRISYAVFCLKKKKKT